MSLSGEPSGDREALARECGVSNLELGVEALTYLEEICGYRSKELTPDFDLAAGLPVVAPRSLRGMFQHVINGERMFDVVAGLGDVDRYLNEIMPDRVLTVRRYLQLWAAARSK